MGADTPEIAVGTVNGELYLGLSGRATQRTCPTADQLVQDYLATRPPQPSVVIDLTGCEWVDSTFAGWLVGLSKRLERMRNGRATVTGCTERCRNSLETMRLTALLRFGDAGTPAETRAVACATSDKPSKDELKLMLAAHEQLAALGPENQQVFGPIVTMLRRQIEGV